MTTRCCKPARKCWQAPGRSLPTAGASSKRTVAPRRGRKSRELLGPEKPAYYEILYAHVQALHGEYRDAYEIARSGLERAAETRSLVVYLSSLSSLALALMHLGWWGELRGAVESGMELAEKNGNQPWRGAVCRDAGMAAHAGL